MNKRRKLTDKLMTILPILSVLITILPLISISVYLVYKGVQYLNVQFLTELPKPVGQPGGGMANSIVGSGIVVGLAGLIGSQLQSWLASTWPNMAAKRSWRRLYGFCRCAAGCSVDCNRYRGLRRCGHSHGQFFRCCWSGSLGHDAHSFSHQNDRGSPVNSAPGREGGGFGLRPTPVAGGFGYRAAQRQRADYDRRNAGHRPYCRGNSTPPVYRPQQPFLAQWVERAHLHLDGADLQLRHFPLYRLERSSLVRCTGFGSACDWSQYSSTYTGSLPLQRAFVRNGEEFYGYCH